MRTRRASFAFLNRPSRALSPFRDDISLDTTFLKWDYLRVSGLPDPGVWYPYPGLAARLRTSTTAIANHRQRSRYSFQVIRVNEDSLSMQATLKEAAEGETGERRAKPRFPLQLPVSFRTLSPPHCSGAPSGTTVNISTTSVTFETGENLQPYQHVLLAVEWPARLDNRIPLTLFLDGRILRCENGVAAMRVHKHEFKTRRAPAAPADMDQAPRIGIAAFAAPSNARSA